MRKEPLCPDAVYNIYNRGVDHGDIFFTRANYIFFLRLPRDCCLPEAAKILAYCLMPNHYHLVLRVLVDDFGRKVMQPFLVSSTKSINKQQERSGHLFQGPYQIRRVTTDGDLIHLSRYVHRNPVAAGFVPAPDAWEYSSYPEYAGLRNGTLPPTTAVLDQFPSRAAYVDYVCAPDDPRVKMAPELLIDG